MDLRDRVNIASARLALLLLIAAFVASIAGVWVPDVRSVPWWLFAVSLIPIFVNVATTGGRNDTDEEVA